MITPAEGFTRLQQCVTGYRHKHYAHCRDYAKELTLMCGSLDVAGLIESFDLREDSDAFKNRVKLSQNILLPISNRIQKPFYKALRADDISIEAKPEDKLPTVSDNFYGDDSLKRYLDSQIVNWQFTDPNGWIFVDILAFDPNREKPNTYPKFIGSKNALDYGYVNNKPDYLICDIDGEFYFIHPSIGIKLSPSDSNNGIEPVEGKLHNLDSIESGSTIKIQGKAYLVTITEPKLKNVPAKQVGYEKDVMTEHETFISPIHAALPTMRRAIRFGSELDVSINLHVFPKKYVVEKPCNGYAEDGIKYPCNNGFVQLSNGGSATCKNCNGSGTHPYHTSAQDVVAVPEGLVKSGEVKLSDLTHYEATDVETPTFLNQFVSALSDQCLTDIFQTNYFSIANEKTATEVKVNYDDIYDTLHPFTLGYSSVWEFCARISGEYKDIVFDTLEMKFPRDLQLQSLDELIQSYKNSEGSPVDVRDSIGKKILRATYRSGDKEYNRALVKRSLEPFANKSSSEITTIISNNLASQLKIWTWANFEDLFMEYESTTDVTVMAAMAPALLKKSFEDFCRPKYDLEMSRQIEIPTTLE